jgi:serine protease Do
MADAMRKCLPVLVAAVALSGCHRSATVPVSTGNAQPSAPSPAVGSFTPLTGPAIAAGDVPLLEQINRENIRVISSALPCLVRISATMMVNPATPSRGASFPFEHHENQYSPFSAVAYGAGVIIGRDGLIVTNSHVVDDSQSIEVQMADHRVFPAKIVGSDPRVDVAVLKIDAHDLKPLPWGDSEKVRVGEQVFAIGDPFDLGDSASRGIISATGRNIPDPSASFQDYLQTDAAINPGNSGGALINIHGELIGINVEIASLTGADRGVGFALPTNLLRYAVSSLLNQGRAAHGFLGFALPSVIDEGVIAQLGLGTGEGALLAGVYPRTPAARAKLQPADFITEIDGHKVDSIPELEIITSQLPVGRQAEVKYIRDGENHSTFLNIPPAPPSHGHDPMPILDESPGVAETPGLLVPSGSEANVLSGLQITDLDGKLRGKFKIDDWVTAGAVVTGVQSGSVAETRGFAQGDVIEMVCVRRAETLRLKDAVQLSGIAARLRPDQGVALLVGRGPSTRFLYLPPLQQRPQNAPC